MVKFFTLYIIDKEKKGKYNEKENYYTGNYCRYS